MMYLLGFIGVGNMGGALARAAAKTVPAEQILLSNRTPSKAQALAEELGCAAADAATVAASSKFIFLGVKPKDMAACLAEIRPILTERGGGFVLVSMAAGLDTAAIQTLAGDPWPVIRLCPNTPVAVGKGLTAWCSRDTSPEDEQTLADAMAASGLWDACPEAQMDVASVLGGCTPAFAYMFIEALSDGAVRCGMTRAQALAYAAKAVEGAAALCGAGEKHPGALKDAVCSPGGSTIEGVLSLEKNAFRSAAAEAVVTAVEKTRRMGK
ncbi:MAG: pyrroline-5-carboxylate reductase [Oscillospiraceae bacterium]|nr:pyrroline-5-carboxylate reductase [Oscillospiraceae bacterium]